MKHELPDILGEPELKVARVLVLQFAHSTALADHVGDFGTDVNYLAATVGLTLPLDEGEAFFDIEGLEAMGAQPLYAKDGIIMRLRDLNEACAPDGGIELGED